MRQIRSLVGALLLSLLASCSAGSDKAAAEAGVQAFHAQYNADAFRETYAGAAPDFKATTSESDWIDAMTAVKRRSGSFKSTTETSWQVTAATDVTAVNLVYESTFADLIAVERFSFAIRDGKATLVGYRIE